MPETSTSPYFLAHQQAQHDLAQLQGVWTSISGRRRAELLIAGNLLTVKFLDGALYMGTFDLDVSDGHPVMDMRIDEGPIKHKGLIAQCIYELAGDTLRWCPGVPGTDERPAGFPAEDAEDGLCLILRREYPRWRNE